MEFDAQGWLDDAIRRESPNRHLQDNPREIIVMHYTAGYTTSSAVNTFANPESKASAHFVVGSDGAITQMVRTSQPAWHAGGGVYDGRSRVNDFSVGIEIINPGYHFRAEDGGYLNWQRRRVTPAQLAPFPGMTVAKDPWVGSAAVHWPNFPSAQLDAVEALTRALLAAYPSIRDIVGHRDVDGVRKLKVDPGPAFPMRRFRMLLDRRDDEEQPLRMRVNVVGSTLNVRGGPAQSFETLAWGPLNHGDEVERLGAQGDWYRIRRWIGGAAKEGWVFARYLVPA